MANPKQTHVQLVGTAYGWSEAQYEHKAFNYFAAKKLLAIPFIDWNSTATGNDYWTYFHLGPARVLRRRAHRLHAKGVLSSRMHDMYHVNWYNELVLLLATARAPQRDG